MEATLCVVLHIPSDSWLVLALTVTCHMLRSLHHLGLHQISQMGHSKCGPGTIFLAGGQGTAK
jgi:hypothetical protein